MKFHSLDNVFEGYPAHYFLELFTPVLGCDNNETTMEILQVAELRYGVLDVCGMLNLYETIRHLSLVEPYHVHCPCPVC